MKSFFYLRSSLLLIICGLTGVTFAAHRDTVMISSQVMDTSYAAIVVIPESVQQNPAARFPAVYLLHGWSGNYTNWPAKADLEKYADKFQMILVCPEGGFAGWYLDSPMNPRSQFESYITREVIPFIDAHYPTRADSSGRAICGLSMGGHGALYLLIRHPELFIAAGSMSGVLELNQSTVKYSIAELLGDYATHQERWRRHSVLHLLPNLVGHQRFILLDCGVEDKFIQINRAVHQRLLELSYPHVYIERPGGHNWDYWTTALPYHLLFFRQIFDGELKFDNKF